MVPSSAGVAAIHFTDLSACKKRFESGIKTAPNVVSVPLDETDTSVAMMAGQYSSCSGRL